MKSALAMLAGLAYSAAYIAPSPGWECALTISTIAVIAMRMLP